MGEIDPSFIQELHDRPKLAVTEDENIPQIDLSSLPNWSPADCNADLVVQVREACKNWGFFQVCNHGVPMEIRENLMSATKRFFSQPAEEKRKVTREKTDIQLGYYDSEHTTNIRDWKEVFDIFAEVPMKLCVFDDDQYHIREYVNKWPQHPPELREACEEYVKHVQRLSYKLLEVIAVGLNIPSNRFEPFFSKDQTSLIRLNHYPSCPAPDRALGIGAHKDVIALTILAQDDVGGLEVKRKTDGEWISVKPIPNTFIINIGDLIQVWTNGLYESVEHRVMVNYVKERYSIPFFFGPSHYTMVEPLPELTSEQNPAKFKSYNWGKFYAARRLSRAKKHCIKNT